MNLELFLVFIILIITTIMFIWGKIRSDLVAVMSMLALVLTGLITVEDALAGFSNNIVIMIAGLFVVGAGIFRTGLAEMAGRMVVKWAKGSETKLLVMLMLLVAVLSAFMSNTGTVAVLIPVIMSVAASMKLSPSKFLMPVAFASSFGGVLTLIGTPPNLIASQTLAEYGYDRLAFFDFTPLGIITIAVGVLFLLFFGKYLVKGNAGAGAGEGAAASPEELMSFYKLSGKLHQVKIGSESNLIGEELQDLRLPDKYNVYALHIDRKYRDKSLRTRTRQISAKADTEIKQDDTIFMSGSKKDVDRFAKDADALVEKQGEEETLVGRRIGVAEILFTPHSKFLNRQIKDVNLRETFGLNIIGMNRRGKYFFEDWGGKKIEFGDALLVHGQWKDIEEIAKEEQDVVVVGKTGEQASQAKASGKAPVAAVIMLAMLTLMTFEIFAPVTSVLIAAVAMVLTGCLRNMNDAYSRINWESVILIGAMLPMATALEQTGGVLFLSDLFIDTLGALGPLALMAGFYISTMLFSQFISNTATAVLFAPIAITTAVQVGVSPYPFVIAVAVAASMAFATPVASPPNALVMTAGGYSFMDFFRAGLPLQIVLFIAMMIGIPIFFPM